TQRAPEDHRQRSGLGPPGKPRQHADPLRRRETLLVVRQTDVQRREEEPRQEGATRRSQQVTRPLRRLPQRRKPFPARHLQQTARRRVTRPPTPSATAANRRRRQGPGRPSTGMAETMTTAPAVRFARPYDGRHRAEDISNDITVANMLRYHWHRTLTECVPHTGHLGTRARHTMPDDIQQQLDTLRRVY